MIREDFVRIVLVGRYSREPCQLVQCSRSRRQLREQPDLVRQKEMLGCHEAAGYLEDRLRGNIGNMLLLSPIGNWWLRLLGRLNLIISGIVKNDIALSAYEMGWLP